MMARKQLIVKRSTLPGSGKGLFTKSPIPKNTRIAKYAGKITTWENADHDGGKNAYIFYVNKNHVIDAKNSKNALARYANDAEELGRLKKLENNTAYAVENKEVFLKALTDIPAGAEILVGYGKEYWYTIKKNIPRKKTKKSATK